MCPVCFKTHQTLMRYSTAVCNNCLDTYKTRDKNGNVISFYNTDMMGCGCEGKKVVDGVTYIVKEGNCYVNNMECMAGEARFGGIVVCAKVDSTRTIKVKVGDTEVYNFNPPKETWVMHREGDIIALMHDQACLLNAALNTTEQITSLKDGNGYDWTASIMKRDSNYFYKNSRGLEYLLTKV